MKVKISSNISELRVGDFKSLLKLNDIQDKKNGPTISEKIEVNAMFSSATVKELREFDVKSNNKLYYRVLKMLDTYHPMPMPPPKVKFGEQTYVLTKDFSKLKTGWYVDVSDLFADYEYSEESPVPNSNSPTKPKSYFDINPEQLVAMCYIEEGMDYAQQDKGKNILNLSKDRAKVFKEHFKLNHFIDLTTFFLKVWVEWKGPSIQNRMREKELHHLKENLRLLSGKLQLMK